MSFCPFLAQINSNADQLYLLFSVLNFFFFWFCCSVPAGGRQCCVLAREEDTCRPAYRLPRPLPPCQDHHPDLLLIYFQSSTNLLACFHVFLKKITSSYTSNKNFLVYVMYALTVITETNEIHEGDALQMLIDAIIDTD